MTRAGHRSTDDTTDGSSGSGTDCGSFLLLGIRTLRCTGQQKQGRQSETKRFSHSGTPLFGNFKMQSITEDIYFKKYDA
jgi:hypothetical protein